MTEIRNYDSAHDVAVAAAENAIELLRSAIERNGNASWVLAGGSSPLAAYHQLALVDGFDTVDWSRVTIIMGDERFVPFDDPQSNWGTIIQMFDQNESLARVNCLVPAIAATVEQSASDYAQQLQSAGITTFDLVWLGVGEDGHTLSLFPGHPAFIEPADNWVIPIHGSPKPPSERFTLSLKAMEHVDELVIFAVGAAKQQALKQARLKRDLPIAIVADTVETSGGEVRWLYDEAGWED